jgi:pyruvate ferredoxin oxidoreductase gamma subunit
VLDGLKPAGVVVIDSDRKAAELKLNTTAKVITLPATEIAMEVTGRPLGNTVLLGAFAAITGEIGLEALQHSVRARFRGEAGEKNALAAQRGYEYVKGG